MAEVHGNPVATTLDSVTNNPTVPKSTGDSSHSYDATLRAGERNEDSATASHVINQNENDMEILSIAGAITIGASAAANDTHLNKIHVHTALVGTLTIAGFADEGGNATSYVLPAGTVGEISFGGALNSAGTLTMTLSSATDYTTNTSVAVFTRAV